MRTSYTVSFAAVPQVAYQQARYNLPLVRYVQVQNPDLLDPLRNLPPLDQGGRTSPTILSPDLVSAYSHQYNFTIERRFANLDQVRLGYVGSRAFKLINIYIQNRGEPVPGIPLITDTVDLRRPDPRYYEVKRVLNGGIAYLDAAQASISMPARRGLAWSASYTFGKAIDEGSDYAFTAANKDMSTGRSQWQYDSARDKKSLSTFDSTHALLMAYSYDLPRLAAEFADQDERAIRARIRRRRHVAVARAGDSLPPVVEGIAGHVLALEGREHVQIQRQHRPWRYAGEQAAQVHLPMDNQCFGGIICTRRWEKVGEIRKKW